MIYLEIFLYTDIFFFKNSRRHAISKLIRIKTFFCSFFGKNKLSAGLFCFKKLTRIIILLKGVGKEFQMIRDEYCLYSSKRMV